MPVYQLVIKLNYEYLIIDLNILKKYLGTLVQVNNFVNKFNDLTCYKFFTRSVIQIVKKFVYILNRWT